MAAMTERDYINATNLAKAKAASVIIASILALTEEEKRDRADALLGLYRLIDRNESLIKIIRADS